MRNTERNRVSARLSTYEAYNLPPVELTAGTKTAIMTSETQASHEDNLARLGEEMNISCEYAVQLQHDATAVRAEAAGTDGDLAAVPQAN